MIDSRLDFSIYSLNLAFLKFHSLNVDLSMYFILLHPQYIALNTARSIVLFTSHCLVSVACNGIRCAGPKILEIGTIKVLPAPSFVRPLLLAVLFLTITRR
jgi:hypothetical protein